MTVVPGRGTLHVASYGSRTAVLRAFLPKLKTGAWTYPGEYQALCTSRVHLRDRLQEGKPGLSP